jgi:tRNA-Thr(GGU) m(6)t(6)A37 methyltransferase TsaA
MKRAFRLQPNNMNDDIRPGEEAVDLPAGSDAGVYFIGRIRTPWLKRADCPKRGTSDGPVCAIVVDERWCQGLEGVEAFPRLQILYWMHQARRDLVRQVPRSHGRASGTFALRSPVRPNAIASSIVDVVDVVGNTIRVRGLDCLDGTPLIDIKPYRPA